MITMITTCRISCISKWPLSIELHPQSLCSWRESKKSADLFCVLVFIGAQENWVRIEFALEIAYEVECCGKQVTAPTSKMQDSKSCASSFDTSVASPAYSRCPAAGGSRANSRSHVKMLRISCGCGFFKEVPLSNINNFACFSMRHPNPWHLALLLRRSGHLPCT